MNMVSNWLLENSLIVAAALPIVWLVGRCRSTRPAELHLLWLVLLVKLVTPPVAQWPLALDDIARLFRPQAGLERTASFDTAIPRIDFVDAEVEVTTAEVVVVSEDELALATLSPADPSISADVAPASASFPWQRLLLWTWATGTGIVVVVSLSRLLRLARFLRNAEPAPPELQSLVARVAEQFRLTPVPVVQARAFASPCIACLGRPVMLWPDSLCIEDDPRGAESIIAHELAHLARRDHWVARFELLALWAGWWNPLFWFVRWQLHESRELACDALSMEIASHDRRAFAELLLEFSQVRRPALSAVSMVGTGIAARFSLRRRLRMLFDHRVSGRLSFASMALAGAFGLAVLPGFTQGEEKSEDAAPVQEEVGQVIELKVDLKDFEGGQSEDVVKTIKAIEPVVDVDLSDLEISIDNTKPVPEETKPQLVVEAISDDVVESKPGKSTIKKYRVVADGKKAIAEDSDAAQVGDALKLHEGAESIRVRLLAPNVVQIEEIGPNLNSTRVLKLQIADGDPRPKKTRTTKPDPKSGKVLLNGDEDATPREFAIDAYLADRIMAGTSLRGVEVPADGEVAQAARQLEQARAEVAKMAAQAAQERARDDHKRSVQIMEAKMRGDLESLKEDVELAELGVMEKQVELEEAAEQVKKLPDDSGAARRLKLAELAVKRAQLEVSRARRRLGRQDAGQSGLQGM
jgi:beta-lactamase regulating signal transducer with metallopeptidase domain